MLSQLVPRDEGHVPNGRENPQFCQCWKILVSGSVLRSPTLARTILPHSQNWRTHSGSNHRTHNWRTEQTEIPLEIGFGQMSGRRWRYEVFLSSSG